MPIYGVSALHLLPRLRPNNARQTSSPGGRFFVDALPSTKEITRNNFFSESAPPWLLQGDAIRPWVAP
jgi:hypothetical protein